MLPSGPKFGSGIAHSQRFGTNASTASTAVALTLLCGFLCSISLPKVLVISLRQVCRLLDYILAQLLSESDDFYLGKWSLLPNGLSIESSWRLSLAGLRTEQRRVDFLTVHQPPYLRWRWLQAACGNSFVFNHFILDGPQICLLCVGNA